MRDRLTARQTQLLEFLGSYIETAGYAPSVQEVCDFLRIRSKGAAHRHLRTLEDKGYILRKKNLARAIKVIPDGELLTAAEEQPGVAFLDMQMLEDDASNPWAQPTDRLPRTHRHLIVDPALVDAPLQHCLAARAGDDGMFQSGIRKGDLVVIEEASDTATRIGATIAVWHNRQLLVRELTAHGGALRLRATSRTYKPHDITPDDENYRILGVIHLVLHTLRAGGPP